MDSTFGTRDSPALIPGAVETTPLPTLRALKGMQRLPMSGEVSVKGMQRLPMSGEVSVCAEFDRDCVYRLLLVAMGPGVGPGRWVDL